MMMMPPMQQQMVMAQGAPAMDSAAATHRVLECIKHVSGGDDVQPSSRFDELGLTSMQTVQLRDELASAFGLGADDISVTQLLDWSEAGLSVEQVGSELSPGQSAQPAQQQREELERLRLGAPRKRLGGSGGRRQPQHAQHAVEQPALRLGRLAREHDLPAEAE